MSELRGVLTAMVTPFHEDGGVDDAGTRRLARHLVDHGSHGLVIAGTTGEAPTLSDDEKLAVFRAVRDELSDEATLILGTGSNDTLHTVELTKLAAEAGADAAIVVTPYYNRPNRAGLIAHYNAVSEVGLPIVLYNIPSRTALNMPPDLLAELAGMPNIVAVKQANNEELGPVEGLGVLAGNDGVFGRTIEFGGAGGILVASHLVGPQMREMWDAGQDGDLEGVRQIEAELAPIYEAMTVTANPIPVKAALKMLGLIESDALRLPLIPATEEQRQAIRPALEAAGILAAAG
ncbi:MAG: 4-hydroxy-tetrahydrodipicolinate synthase [Actinomycetota bacterium]|nr:4-hydroxy-tetrahydrodipicolinate synthase [Actinomycetota bacterium]